MLARPLQRFTQHTLTTAAALRRRVADANQRGYAWACEEYADGLNSVAAAVSSRDGRVVAALHVYGPASRFPGDRTADEVGELVRTTAAKIRID